MPDNLKLKVIALQRDTESLLKLLGGSEDDRERFWEILKGITTPAVMRIVETEIEAMTDQVRNVTHMARSLEANAKGLGAGPASNLKASA